MKGNCAALKPLIAAGADLNTRDDNGTTPVLHAAVADAVPALEVLVSAGADPDGGGGASGVGLSSPSSTSVMGAAADAGAVASNTTATGQLGGAEWSPLTWSARKGQLSAMQLLLGAGADVDAGAGGAGRSKTTPLIQAALGGHVSCVKLLASYGADPEARDAEGFTAAMWAGIRHPQDSALLSAISAANIEWSSMREKKLLIIEESDD